LNKKTLDPYIAKLSPHAAQLAAYMLLKAEDIAMDWRRYAVRALYEHGPSDSPLVEFDLLQVMAGANPALDWVAGEPESEDQRQAQFFVTVLRFAALQAEV